MPDSSTICRRERTLVVTTPHRGAEGPLHMLMKSTGIEVDGEGEWNARKIHIGVDEQTLESRAVEGSLAIAIGPKEPVDGSNTGDAPMRTHLLNQIPHGQQIGRVTANGAYDTRRCHNAIADRGAAAFGNSFERVAVVPSLPTRRNAPPWKPSTAGAIARDDALRASR